MVSPFSERPELKPAAAILLGNPALFGGALSAGGVAAARMLNVCEEQVPQRLHALSEWPEAHFSARSGAASSLECALLCGLQAAFPDTKSRLLPPLSVESFRTRITHA